MKKKNILLMLIMIMSLIVIIASSIVISKSHLINQKLDKEEKLKNIDVIQTLIKPIEEFSISQRLFLKKMESCFNEGKSSNGYKLCLGLEEQFNKASKSLVVVSELTKNKCLVTLQANIESYMIISNNYKNSNYQFLLSKLRDLEAQLKSKCNI